MKLKAIVLYQPWASLIAIKAKPLEFRGRDYRERDGVVPGQSIAVAAGARKIKIAEVDDLLERLDDESGSTGLVPELAKPFLDRLWTQLKSSASPDAAPYSVIVCTATIGEPKLSVDAMPKWKKFINDSDRLEHAKWAWPMLDVEPTEPIASQQRKT